MKNYFTLKSILSEFSSDAQINYRQLKKDKLINIVYIDCLIDKALLSQSIISPLNKFSGKISIKSIQNCIFSHEIITLNTKNDAINAILNGSVLIFIENYTNALSINLSFYNTRSITEPPTSQVTKGPREGFVEDININISMLRRRLKSPNLAIKNIVVGESSKTKVALVYLENIADTSLAKTIQNKLSKVKIDGIIDSYYIENILEEGKLKFLRRVGNSEKPDVITSRLLEGRIAIIVDGSPIVLTLPFLLVEDLQSPEDYYTIPARASFLRFLRLIGLIIGVLLPGLYVALQSFQYKILPINFLVTLLNSIEGISLPPLIELLFVLFLFDMLSEASARMPKLLGMALSIIGALVLGDTAVQAGIISPPSIVVVAISSIMIFIVPDDVPQIVLLRLLFTIVGGVAGFYGILMSFIMVTTYLVSADGYGTPMLAPYAPTIKSDKKDAIFKTSLLNLRTRPTIIQKKNKTRLIQENDDDKI